MINNVLFFTNCQKVLSFLLQNTEKEYYDREICRLSGISRAGVNFALKDLTKEGLTNFRKQGRMVFYKLKNDDVTVKYLKIVQNICALRDIVEKLKGISSKIVLYGSSAKGENSSESDIDLFVISRQADEVRKIIYKDGNRQKLQYKICSQNEYVKGKMNNPVFYKEVERGIVLWQEK